VTPPACEKCGSELELIGDTPVGPVLQCKGCGRAVPAQQVQLRTLKLPGLDPGRQSVAVKEVEEPIMQRIIGVLKRAGYEVLCTVHRHTRHTCSQCGRNEWHQGGYGADPGVPDLLTRHPSWPAGCWLGIEAKGTKTQLNPTQKALLHAGAIVIARSEADALSAVQRAEADLRSGRESEHDGS
jgi:DNA-directed RNA polymerase subunit M/transcription elongation factor TFIIS